MTKQEKIAYDKQAYERAIYRIHDTDDPELKKHFQGIIESYEKAHPKKVQPSLATKRPQAER